MSFTREIDLPKYFNIKGSSYLHLLVGLLKEKAVDKDLHSMARHETESDKMFSDFKKRIAHDPEQILRYQRNGKRS